MRMPRIWSITLVGAVVAGALLLTALSPQDASAAGARTVPPERFVDLVG